MKLSRLLATITICSALVASGAEANAKSKSRHSKTTHSSAKSSKSKKQRPAAAAKDKDADDAAAEDSDKVAADADDTSGAEAAPSSSSTSTTTTTKTQETTPSEGAAPSESPSNMATEPGQTPSDTTVTPMVEPPPETVPPPSTTTTTTTTTTEKSIVFLPMVSATEKAEHGYTPPLGLAISAGGGAFNFVGGTIRTQTNLGGSWTVRALIGSRSILGLEAAYIGSAQGINSLGFANNATLLGNGVTGNLRLNAPLAVKKFLIEPYGLVGAGWSHYSVVNRQNTVSADVNVSDDVILMPVGGGLAVGYMGFFFDARYEYRFSFDNDLVVGGTSVQRGMDNWTAGGTVGFEF
jgi:hypothetical protein